MNSKLKAVWTDPVWSKVISAGILALLVAAIGIISNQFYSWWPSVAEGLKGMPSKRLSAPTWLIVLIYVQKMPRTSFSIMTVIAKF